MMPWTVFTDTNFNAEQYFCEPYRHGRWVSSDDGYVEDQFSLVHVIIVDFFIFLHFDGKWIWIMRGESNNFF
jgi:hypothetical protein